MSYAHQILFALLFCSLNAFPSTKPTVNNIPDEPIRITPLYVPDKLELFHETINSEKSKSHFQQEKQSDTFSEIEIEEMELVFEESPKEAQCIVNHLLDPAYFPLNENYRSAIFVGEPGSGKTIMAKAIVYKMAQQGWNYKILSSTSLLGEYRNQTAIKLQKELGAIEASNKPTIIVIDELNRLLENTESKHHDTDATATALWTFIDRQKGNEKFFLIGTMNRVNKLPKPYKSRILFDCIEFPSITDSTIKSQTFRKILTSKNIHVDKEVTDTFLDKELEKMGACTGRDLQNISAAICRINRANTPDANSTMMIKKTSISHAISEYIRLKTKMQYDLEDETDDQRQNRFHNENIKLQKEYHAEQKLLHKENQEMQERHFVQQQKIQVAIADNQRIFTEAYDMNKYYLSEDGKNLINSLISDEQKQLYNQMMANTRARETREAAEKAVADKIAAQIAAEKAADEKIKNSWGYKLGLQ